jgi:hypothetical protein
MVDGCFACGAIMRREVWPFVEFYLHTNFTQTPYTNYWRKLPAYCPTAVTYFKRTGARTSTSPQDHVMIKVT